MAMFADAMSHFDPRMPDINAKWAYWMDTCSLTCKVKDLMRSKNTSGYFSFYVDNITPLENFHNLRQSP